MCAWHLKKIMRGKEGGYVNRASSFLAAFTHTLTHGAETVSPVRHSVPSPGFRVSGGRVPLLEA